MIAEAGLLAVVAMLGGVLVELIRTRRKTAAAAKETAKVVHEVTPNSGSSMKDAVVRIESTVNEIREEHGDRLAKMEVLISQRRPFFRRS